MEAPAAAREGPEALTAPELCAELGARPRTVYRDIEALKRSRIVVFSHPVGTWHCILESLCKRGK